MYTALFITIPKLLIWMIILDLLFHVPVIGIVDGAVHAVDVCSFPFGPG